jgi:tetratricopeptide (TPR) repeat protein
MDTQEEPREIAEQAKTAYQARDFQTASDLFSRAADGFSKAGDMLSSAEMKNNQAVCLLRDKQPAAALEAVSGSDQVFARGGDLQRQGMALANQASAWMALKEDQKAIEYFNKAGEILDNAGEFPYRYEIMKLLAALHLRRFHVLSAIIAIQSGLAGIQNPTPSQRLMKKLLSIHL